MTIVSENDWKCFCEEWGGIEEKGISVRIELSNNAGNNLGGLCKEMPSSEEPFTQRDEENNEIESQQPVVRTFPEVIQKFTSFLFPFVVLHTGECATAILNYLESQTLTIYVLLCLKQICDSYLLVETFIVLIFFIFHSMALVSCEYFDDRWQHLFIMSSNWL